MFATGLPGLADEANEPVDPLPKHFVFPAEGQDAEQQTQDELGCNDWAVDQTDFDPFEVEKPATPAPAAAQATKGGRRGGGALRGAAAGYIIGDLVNDEGGEGAAIGAVVGARKSRKRAAQQSATAKKAIQDADQAVLDARQAQIDEFMKARVVCLEAKGYKVSE